MLRMTCCKKLVFIHNIFRNPRVISSYDIMAYLREKQSGAGQFPVQFSNISLDCRGQVLRTDLGILWKTSTSAFQLLVLIFYSIQFVGGLLGIQRSSCTMPSLTTRSFVLDFSIIQSSAALPDVLIWSALHHLPLGTPMVSLPPQKSCVVTWW